MAKKKVPVIIEGVMHFTCSKCQQLKPKDLMKKDLYKSCGIGSICKACHCITSLKSTAKKPEQFKAYKAKYNRDKYAFDLTFKLKDKIRGLVKIAIQNNKLIKPNNCFKCNSTENIEAHHPEYSIEKALDVIWLCRNCHRALHQSLNESTEE